MGVSIGVKAVVSNHVDHELRVAGESLEWGKWVQKPVNCAPMRITNPAFYAEGAGGSATGTQGQLKYRIIGVPDAILVINWDIPFIGQNAFSANIMPAGTGLVASITGPEDGNDVTLSVSINHKITD